MMTRKSNRLSVRAYNYIRRMSLQRRITLSILAAFILTLPSVALSLFYFTGLIEDIELIIDRDVTMGRTATELSLSMLEIRRQERNYRLFGRVAEEQRVTDEIARIRSMLESSKNKVLPNEKQLLSRLNNHLSIYENSFEMLVLYITDHPPENHINQLRSELAGRISEFQKNYRDILSKLEDVPDAERDSVLARATESLDTFSFDYLFDSKTDNSQSVQPSFFRENLETSAQNFLDAAHELEEASWQNMLRHRMESRHIEARANRNIITVLILTGIICIFMITSLPRRIVRPITSLNRLLIKAGEGDFTAKATISTNDEISDLAQSYNHVIDRLRHYDNMKTQKIASQKRLIDRLLENLPQPVAIVRPDYTLPYYNTAFADLFGGTIPAKPPEGGLVMEKHDAMRPFMEQLQAKLTSGTANFMFDITSKDGRQVTLKGRTVLNTVMELDSIVIVQI